MSEQVKNPDNNEESERSAEQQSAIEQAFVKHANEYIDKYTDNLTAEERETLLNDVLESMRSVQGQDKAELVKAYADIFAGIKEYGYQHASVLETNMYRQDRLDDEKGPGVTVNDTETKKTQRPEDDSDEGQSADQDAAKSDGSKAPGKEVVLDDPSNPNVPVPAPEQDNGKKIGFFKQLKGMYVGAWESLTHKRVRRSDFEADGAGEIEYKMARRESRIRRMAAVGFIAYNVAAVGLIAKGMNELAGVVAGWYDDDGSSNAHGVAGAHGSSHAEANRSNNPWDADGNAAVDQHEYSIQSHHIQNQFLDNPDRQGNDFNHIELHYNQDGSVDTDDLYGQLGEQFRNAPDETAAQFEQFHRLGIELPDELKELNFKPGETPSEYTERVGDLLHSNRDLKDKAADFALDQLHGKSLEDLTRDYESNYIVPDGHGGWMIETDPDVTSADPNDRILVMGQANGYIEGVRIPCGQPIRIPIEVPQSAPQGVGAAAPADYSGQGGATNYQPVAHVTPETTPGGQGNGGGSHGGNEGGQGGSSGGGNEGGDDKLAGKAGDFHADEGAPLASSGPLEGPAQTQTDSVFVDQRPGQAIPEGQTGSQAENAVQGTGGGRTEQATGNQGEGAAAADLNQSHESAEQEATTDPNATPEGAAGTETANPYQ